MFWDLFLWKRVDGKPSRAMAGSIDGFAYYHTALSEQDIATVFQGRGSNAGSIIESTCPPLTPLDFFDQPGPENIQGEDSLSQSDSNSSSNGSPNNGFVDPCRCSVDGFSGDVFTDAIGCSIEAFFGDLCYVQEPAQCPEAFPSTNFQGAAYRRCD